MGSRCSFNASITPEGTVQASALAPRSPCPPPAPPDPRNTGTTSTARPCALLLLTFHGDGTLRLAVLGDWLLPSASCLEATCRTACVRAVFLCVPLKPVRGDLISLSCSSACDARGSRRCGRHTFVNKLLCAQRGTLHSLWLLTVKHVVIPSALLWYLHEVPRCYTSEYLCAPCTERGRRGDGG